MKKPISFLMFLLSAISAFGQNTNYGGGSGTGGTNSTFFGYYSGHAVTGSDNSFLGTNSGLNTTSGNYNTTVGSHSLYSNTTGGYNTGVGFKALYYCTTNNYNTAVGYAALHYNTGDYNTATGMYALYNNSTGTTGTAVGYQALYLNTTGIRNTAMGYQALYSNVSNDANTAVGYQALYANTTGGAQNTAIGHQALFSNTTGLSNTGNGHWALYSNTTGGGNTGSGFGALFENTTGGFNTGDGEYTLYYNTTGDYNSALGYNAGPSSTNTGLSNTTVLGYNAVPTASNQVRVGNSSVTSIGGYQNFSNISDGRFKVEVREDVSGLDFINQLRPITYALDRAAINTFLGIPDSVSRNLIAIAGGKISKRQTGFIAQEVEATIKKSGFTFYGVEAPQNDSDHYGIRYAEFVVPLVKAIQELSAQVNQHQKTIDSLLNQLNQKYNNTTPSNARQSQGQVSLFQNNPNPFSVDTNIRMTLPEGTSQASVTIYNLEGTQLKTILVKERGDVTVKLSGSELNAGMYLYALIVDGQVIDTKRMILTK